MVTESVDIFAERTWNKTGLVERRRVCDDELLDAEMIVRRVRNKMGSGRVHKVRE